MGKERIDAGAGGIETGDGLSHFGLLACCVQ